MKGIRVGFIVGTTIQVIVSLLGDRDTYRKAMPQTDELKARFGADVMAAEIEKAYFAALNK
jgi:hypothetical protein